MTKDERRAIARWIVKSILGIIGYGALIFAVAGRLDWLWGWVFVVLLALFLAAHPLILISRNPALLAEREKGLRDKRVQTWDKWVAGLGAGVFPMLGLVIAGLDVRFGWTGPLGLGCHLAGLGLMLAGHGLFLWAMASNPFMAEGVRIQSERGHTVADGGPYRHVRHPAYSGAVLSAIGTPLMLGSPWAFTAVSASVILYIVRTALEDRFLRKELAGYEDYTRRTRYRLLPRVW